MKHSTSWGVQAGAFTGSPNIDLKKVTNFWWCSEKKDWGSLRITGASSYKKYLSVMILKPFILVLDVNKEYVFMVAYKTSFLWFVDSLEMLSKIIWTESPSLEVITP